MSLSPRWIIFLGMFLVLATLVANTIEAVDPVSATSANTIYSVIQQIGIITSPDTENVIQRTFTLSGTVFDLLIKMVVWDYNFLNNFVGTIFRMILFAISFAVLFGIALIIIKR